MKEILMEIRNEQRAHRADSAQLLQRFLRIEHDFKRIQKGHQESLEREREFERRISALEELIKQQAPAAAPSSFGLDDLALRYVLEYTADQQRQREELGKLALAPPPGQGLARVAEDLGVDPGRLSMQGKGKVMVMDMTTAKAAQAWLDRFRAGGGVGTQRGGHVRCCSRCVGRRRCTGCAWRCRSWGCRGYTPSCPRTGATCSSLGHL
jgi:hypothetical protein